MFSCYLPQVYHGGPFLRPPSSTRPRSSLSPPSSVSPPSPVPLLQRTVPKRVKKLCDEGRFEEALQVVRSIDHRLDPDLIFSAACVRLLQRCTKLKLLADGKLVHSHIISIDYKPDVFLGTTLVWMYVKCGRMKEAHEVFDSLLEKNTVTYAVIIDGYVQEQQPREAMRLFQQMREEGLEGDKYTFVSILSVCGTLRLLKEGKELHELAIKAGLHTESYVANTLVDMYAKCGDIEEARKVFDAMPERDVVAWNSMIGGYARQGLNKKALALFNEMLQKGMKPDPVSFVNLINTCDDLDSVKKIHKQLKKYKFETHVIVQTALLSAYTNCGSVKDARQIFDQMASRDTVAWNAMLGSYAQDGNGGEALRLFVEMQKEGLSPDQFTFVHILNACTSLGAVEQGNKIQSLAVKYGYETDVFVGTALVDMHVKRGDIDTALQIFQKMPIRDVITWNILIGALVFQGRSEEAVKLFYQMQDEGRVPDSVTTCSVVTACAKLASLELGRQLHSRILGTGDDCNLYVGSGLVSMYSKCGSLAEARQLFDKMPERNVVTWTALIAGCVQHGQPGEALQLFRQMETQGVEPNEITLVGVLNACAHTLNLQEGKRVHAYIKKKGLELDTFLGTSLVNMYAKCGSLDDAREAFVQMSGHNSVVCWTALISGYARGGRPKEALRLFWQMQREGVRPNEVTFASVLNVCNRPSSLEEGRRIHSHLLSNGSDTDLFVGTALVSMYGKCGSIEDARQVFDRMPLQNVFSWTAMIGAYSYCGLEEEAFVMYRLMKGSEVKPNQVTFVNILGACGSLGSLDLGKQLHNEIIQSGFDSDVYVGNSLIDMYCKCGSTSEARKVFNGMRDKEVISWNTMIKGYTLHKQLKEALTLFQQMGNQGFKENSATFGLMLSACGAASALKEGREVHKRIRESGYEGELFTSNALISMYVKCKSLVDAQQVFETLPNRNVDSWSAMFEGHAQSGSAPYLFKLFQQMQVEGVKPNEEIFLQILSTCASSEDLAVGKQLHSEVIESGLEYRQSVKRSLADMYIRCGSPEDAQGILDKLSSFQTDTPSLELPES